jgi:hypothetical protein
MLVRIMAMQAEFQSRTPNGVVSFKESTPDRVAEMVRVQTLACIGELTEALNEVGWKPWASSNHFNVEAFRSELIDVLRFWLNLVHISGMSAEGVLAHYEESLAKTNARVENGYTGLHKCPACKRAYDDKAVGCWPRTEDDPPTPAYCVSRGAHVSATGDPMEFSVSQNDWVLAGPA